MNSYYGQLINNDFFTIDIILDTVNNILKLNYACKDEIMQKLVF